MFNRGHSRVLREYDANAGKYPLGYILAPPCSQYGGFVVPVTNEYRVLAVWGWPSVQDLAQLDEAGVTALKAVLSGMGVTYEPACGGRTAV